MLIFKYYKRSYTAFIFVSTNQPVNTVQSNAYKEIRTCFKMLPFLDIKR